MSTSPLWPEQPSAQSELLPHVQALLQRMARKPGPPLHQLSPQAARARYAAGAEVLEVAAEAGVHVQALSIPVRDGAQIGARLYRPDAGGDAAAPGRPAASACLSGRNGLIGLNGPIPFLVFFHGGGFVMGSVATHDTLCRVLCQRSGCGVLSVDYRLAPEYRFPTAFHDAWDAVQWCAQHAAAWGLDAQRMAVGGDSAGGTLAAACAVQAVQQGVPLRLQLLFYPGMHARPQTASRQRYAQGFLLEEAQLQWMFDLYAPDAVQQQDWRFCPLHAPVLDGAAPLWLGLAQCDPLCDEGLQWADSLRMAGVPVQLELYRGVIHEFIKMGRAIPEARQAHADAAAALRAALLQVAQ